MKLQIAAILACSTSAALAGQVGFIGDTASAVRLYQGGGHGTQNALITAGQGPEFGGSSLAFQVDVEATTITFTSNGSFLGNSTNHFIRLDDLDVVADPMAVITNVSIVEASNIFDLFGPPFVPNVTFDDDSIQFNIAGTSGGQWGSFSGGAGRLVLAYTTSEAVSVVPLPGAFMGGLVLLGACSLQKLRSRRVGGT